MHKKVSCFGGAHFDHTFELIDQKMVLKTSNPVQSHMTYGGVIRNVGHHLALLSHDVSLISLVGSDVLGEKLIKDMGGCMDVSDVEMLDDYQTAGYYAIINHQGGMDVGFADMAIYDVMDEAFVLRHLNVLNQSAVVLMDMNLKLEAIIAVLKHKKNQIVVLVGVSGPKMSHCPKDLSDVDYLICNMDEAQAYFDVSITDIKALGHLFKNTGLKHLILTDGDKAVFYQGDGIEKVYPVKKMEKKELVDVTGAGDAFSAALVHGLIHEQSIDQMIAYGMANARLTLKTQGSINFNLTKEILKKAVDENV